MKTHIVFVGKSEKKLSPGEVYSNISLSEYDHCLSCHSKTPSGMDLGDRVFLAMNKGTSQRKGEPGIYASARVVGNELFVNGAYEIELQFDYVISPEDVEPLTISSIPVLVRKGLLTKPKNIILEGQEGREVAEAFDAYVSRNSDYFSLRLNSSIAWTLYRESGDFAFSIGALEEDHGGGNITMHFTSVTTDNGDLYIDTSVYNGSLFKELTMETFEKGHVMRNINLFSVSEFMAEHSLHTTKDLVDYMFAEFGLKHYDEIIDHLDELEIDYEIEDSSEDDDDLWGEEDEFGDFADRWVDEQDEEGGHFHPFFPKGKTPQN